MFLFDNVVERDIDLILMRSFATQPAFADIFLECVGWGGASVVSVEHSLTDPELGESDITVIVELGGARYALLVENKIDADAMPSQCQRYHKRGENGVFGGQYDDFAVFITAPFSYLNSNAEAKKYKYCISYEALLAYFEVHSLPFECELIRSAIQKKESRYTVREVPAVTEFWNKLYEYVEASNFSVIMNAPRGAKGSRSTWIYFRVPYVGTALSYKAEKGVVDLEFSGKLSESKRLKADLNLYLTPDMHWENTGKSISLRMKVKTMDLTKPFEQNIENVDIMLAAVEKLTALTVVLNDTGYTL